MLKKVIARDVAKTIIYRSANRYNRIEVIAALRSLNLESSAEYLENNKEDYGEIMMLSMSAWTEEIIRIIE